MAQGFKTWGQAEFDAAFRALMTNRGGRGMKNVMDHPLIDLINARIRKAEAEGDFDNLQGAGKPLPLHDNSEDAVMNRILKDNGAVPEFVSLSRELSRLREELLETADRTDRKRLIADMSMIEARIEIARKRG